MRTAADGAERTQARPAAPLFVEFADGRFELVADGRSRLSIELADVTADHADYIMMHCDGIEIDRLTLNGNYAFHFGIGYPF